MKQTLEEFEARGLEYENLYNEEDERREYNSIWYTSFVVNFQIVSPDWIICYIKKVEID